MDNGSDNIVFAWRGRDRDGRMARGDIEAPSPALARARLHRQGIAGAKVRRKRKPLPGLGGLGGGRGGGLGGGHGGRGISGWLGIQRIRPADIAVFTRQLATMAKAGIPLVQSFDIAGASFDHPAMRRLAAKIRNDVAAGASLASALRKHPRHFDELYLSLIAAGEASGTPDVMLARIAAHREKSEALKARLRKALAYPAIVAAVALAVTGILLVQVVPRFAATYAGFGAELPAFTLFVLGVSDFAQAWWAFVLGGLVGINWLHRRAARSSPAYRAGRDRLLLRAPLAGDIIRKAVAARFARTLATTFAAGVPLVDALDSAAGAAGNIVYAGAIRRIRDEVTTGAGLHSSIRATGLFPPMLLQMAAIGEESGTLDAMLEKAAGIYEDAVDNAVEGISALVEPVIMTVLSLLVGGLMAAMYLPIFMLGSVV